MTVVDLLKSSTSDLVLKGLNILFEKIEKTELSAELAAEVFPVLVPCLKSNHAKIRFRAFVACRYCLETYPNDINHCVQALPDCLLSLTAVDKKLVDTSQACIAAILNSSNVDDWWPIIDSTLQTSRSIDQRIRILTILCDHAEDVPLGGVAKLLSDSNLRVQRLAVQILKSQPERVENALENAKKAKEDEGRARVPRKPKVIRQENVEDTQKNTERFKHEEDVEEESGESGEEVENEPVLVTPQVRTKESNTNSVVSSESFSSDKDKHKTQSSGFSQQSNMDSSASKRSIRSTASRSDKSSLYSAASMHEVGKEEPVPEDKSTESVREPEETTQKPAKLDERKQMIQEHSESVGRESEQNDSNFSFEGDKQEESNYDSEQEEEEEETTVPSHWDVEGSSHASEAVRPVGQFPTRKIQPIEDDKDVFKLRDMSLQTWTERVEFLEALTTAIHDRKVRNPPQHILDCVMTCSFPLHPKVLPLVIPIITDIIVANPELLSPFLAEIVEIVLAARRSSSHLELVRPLSEALYLEADVNDLVATAVNQGEESNRPLHIEAFLVRWFALNSEVTLERQTYGDLMCYLVYRALPEAQRCQGTTPRFLSNIKQIITVAARNQTSYFVSFARQQPVEVQQVLGRYMPEKPKPATMSAHSDEDEVLAIESPMQTLREEMKKGKDANFSLMAKAAVLVEVKNWHQTKRLFLAFMQLLSAITDQQALRESTHLQSICQSLFKSPNVLTIVEEPSFTEEMFSGLAVFVWNCPASTLKGADFLYPRLYLMFTKAPGAIRADIVTVTMSIERATGQSFKDLEGIAPAHQQLIEKLQQQIVTTEEDVE